MTDRSNEASADLVDTASARPGTTPAVVLTLLTGATMMGGQVAWMRLAQAQVGSGLLAGTLSLAAAMAGLSVGANLAGRRLLRRGVAGVVVAQQLLAAAALVLAPTVIEWVGLAAVHGLRGSAASLETAQWVLAAAVGAALLVLNVPFGMLLPAAVELDARGREGTVSRRGGLFYALQSGGAVPGAITLGLALPAMIGYRWMLALAGGLHALAAVWVLLLSARRAGWRARPAAEPPDAEDAEGALRRQRRRGVLGLAMWLGLLGLAAELVWTRALIFYLNSSLYVYGMTTAVYVTALMIGSLVGAWLAPLRRRPGQFLAAITLLIGLTMALSAQWVTGLPAWLAGNVSAYSRGQGDLLAASGGWDFVSDLLAMGVATMVVVGPPTMLMGAAFPLLLRLTAPPGASRASRGRATAASHVPGHSGWVVGRVMTWNALGSAIGPVLTFLVLLNLLDGRRSLLALAVGYLVAALWAETIDPATGWSRSGRRRIPADSPDAREVRDQRVRLLNRYRIPFLNIALFAAVVGVCLWQANKGSLFRPAFLWREGKQYDESAEIDTLSLPAVVESRDGVVAVRRNTADGVAELLVNQDVQGDDSPMGLRVQRREGLVPLLLAPHPQPRRTLVVGLGTGTTAGTLCQAGLPRITVAELVEPVALVAVNQFAHANGQLFDFKVSRLDPLADAPPASQPDAAPAERTQIVVEQADGRTALRLARQPLDLILVDIVYPTAPGAGGLFSRQFYRLAYDRLAPDGLLVHWLPLWQISPADAAGVVRAFLDGFGPDDAEPGVGRHTQRVGVLTAFGAGQPMVALVGCRGGGLTTQGLNLSHQGLARRIAWLAEACRKAEDAIGPAQTNLAVPEQLWADLLPESLLRAWAGDARAATDSFPRTELRSPLGASASFGPDNAAALTKLGYAGDGYAAALAGTVGPAGAADAKALGGAITGRRKMMEAFALGLADKGGEHAARVYRLLKEAASADPDNQVAALLLHRADYYAQLAEATGLAQAALTQLSQGRLEEFLQAANEAIRLFEAAADGFPLDTEALVQEAHLLALVASSDRSSAAQGNQRALAAFQRVIHATPRAADPLFRQAQMLHDLGRDELAAAALKRARDFRSDIPDAYKNLNRSILLELKRAKATTQPEQAATRPGHAASRPARP